MDMVNIREECAADYDAVRIVNDRAFGAPEEGNIVEKLRNTCRETLSLVAVSDERIVGHIFFSPVTVGPVGRQVMGLGLAPMAVMPEFQRQGIGSFLVEDGIRRIRDTDCPFILVVGHADYYPRFGFEPARPYGLQCQWEGVPDEAFMILRLDTSRMNQVSGVARYRDEFDEAM